MNTPDKLYPGDPCATDDIEKPEMQMIAHHVWQMKRRPTDIFNVYLIEDVLIDAGTRLGASGLLKQLANVPLSQVALTHCHPDHQGAVRRICEARGIPLVVPAFARISDRRRRPAPPT